MSFLTLTPASFDRERHLPLLLEADDVEQHIHGYLDRGQLFEIRDADALIGVATSSTATLARSGTSPSPRSSAAVGPVDAPSD
jgi:hypothetical protein